MENIKNYVYNIIRDDDKNGIISNIFDFTIILFIILSVLQVIADTFKLPVWAAKLSSVIEITSIIIFTIEYILRVWTSSVMYPDKSRIISRVKYIFSPMAIVDLVSILPFYIPFIIPIDLRILRVLRIVRLLRLFKINRYTKALTSIALVLKNKSSQLLSSIFVVALLMVISAVIMYNIESSAQPEVFNNALDALWWSVATFTTVGYGDIFPVTVPGKILSAIIALLGIGLVAVPTGIISAGFAELITDEKDKNGEIAYCPHCGKKLK